VPKSSSAFPSLITPFIIHSLRSHARSTLAFVADAHGVTKAALADPLTSSTSTATTVAELTRIDALYEAMTSNHVTRRGSRTQGIGMLSLWTKALRDPRDNGRSASERLMAALKLEIRENRMHGHLPICWAVLCAALGLSLGAYEKQQAGARSFAHTAAAWRAPPT
jgi:urease accessory protein